nr:hypothetical protein BaRGS_011952 [Batillaria attramentaria]
MRTFAVDEVHHIDDPDSLVSRVIQDFDEFSDFVKSEGRNVSLADSRKLLQIVTRAIAVTERRNDVLEIIQVICSSRYLDSHIPCLITKLAAESETKSLADWNTSADNKEVVTEAVEMIHMLVTRICATLPSYASKCSLLLTELLQNKVMSVVRNNRPNLEEDLRAMQDESERVAGMVQTQPRSACRRTRGPDDEDAVPPEDFTHLPLIPDNRDLDWTKKPFLRANKTEGAFMNQDHYLDVQFRLLREDYIRPVREGLREYKKKREPYAKRCLDLRLYYNVRIIGIACGETLDHKLNFDITRFKHVKWEHSKRLPFGALLCLSNDDFNTPYFAVVTGREPTDLQHGVLQVRFENAQDRILEMTPNDVFTMAETPAFFEAYRHVLEALKQMKETPLPFVRHIVECRDDVKPPKYLRTADKVKLKLTSLIRKGSKFDATSVPALQLQEWPVLEETGLDSSQLKAVQTALTKELAIIQGPPGTGKTYIGLKVAEVLLDNKNTWTHARNSRPILVVCYTNHALDQFLEGILGFCPKGIIRVGSRSKNPALEQFNLQTVKRQQHVRMSDELRRCKQALNDTEKAIKMYLAQIDRLDKGKMLDVLDLQGSMLNCQQESLRSLRERVSPNLTISWLALGDMVLQQAGDTDPYTLLEREVTSRILGGIDVCSEGNVSPENVHRLPFSVRAKLYRFWRSKHQQQIAQREAKVKRRPRNDHADPGRQTSGDEDILPDIVLKSVMDRQLYKAITRPLMKQHKEDKNYCVRAWLGVDASSVDVARAIIHGENVRDECDIDPASLSCLPRKSRVQLYRSWLKKYQDFLLHTLEEGKRKKKRKLKWVQKRQEEAKKRILPDDALETVVDKKLFSAIQKEMLQKHDQQSFFMIRAWLGVAEFTRDPQVLETVLNRLTGEEEDIELATEIEENSDGDDDADFWMDERDFSLSEAETFLQVSKPKHKPIRRDSNDNWTIPDWVRKTRKAQMYQTLRSADPMTETEAQNVKDLWDPRLTLKDRVRLYLFWVQKHRPLLPQYLQTAREGYERQSQRRRDLKTAEEIEILSKAPVIGMTTTRAARYRQVLDKIACPIVILEEAAEHLILIGDHQQLRPSPTVYELCRHYQLDLSLFERLVNNKLPHSTLAVQHRMRPEVARLVRHIYPHLEDHEVTLDRPHIRGMKQDVFLFHHEATELTHSETSSKYNEHEAEMVMKLCRYLLLQDYAPHSITVLAAYTGQILKLKNIMQDHVLVTAVDNYQGEENDVIILSLVRSNVEGSVGFLGTDNRVCVALSRARNGLYAFGNFK